MTSFSYTTSSGTSTRNYTCDIIGNPTAISETDSSDNSTRNLALTWTQGRLLSNVSDGSTLNNTYCYNAAGNISQKTLADGSYVIYHYNGGKLEYEEHFNASNVLQKLLKYSYDVSGDVEYLLYKDGDFSNANAFDLYYYVRDGVDNITDIFQLREQSGSGTTVVNRIAAHYEYDPYGNILSVDTFNNDNIGNINPIRYKDYYYDAETGWYQLSSRFYDPEVGRFLNADDLSLLMETDSGVIDKNLYSYCDGNPVMRKDEGGDFWFVGASALSGALAGTGVGKIGQIAVNAAIGGVESIRKGENFFVGAGLGILSGMIGGKGANYKGAVSDVQKLAKKKLAKEDRRAYVKYAKKSAKRWAKYKYHNYRRIALTAGGRYIFGFAFNKYLSSRK